MTDHDLPPDPDLDHVPSDLRLLAGLDGGRVTVLDEDGVGPATLVIVPSMFRRALGLEEAEAD